MYKKIKDRIQKAEVHAMKIGNVGKKERGNKIK